MGKSPLLKLTALLLAALIFGWLLCFRWLDNLPVQAGWLAVAALLSLLRSGAKQFAAELRLFAAFAGFMALFYLLFGLLGLSGHTLLWWVRYGTLRLLLFASTVFTLGWLLSFITMDDIFALPLAPARKRYLLLGCSLYGGARQVMARLELYVGLFPENQVDRPGLRRRFRRRLVTILALILSLLREAELQGELMDNRMRHCFGAGIDVEENGREIGRGDPAPTNRG